MMMPPLTTANVVVPAVCLENIIASVTTRVLGAKCSPLPWMTMMRRPQIIASMPSTNPAHPATAANLQAMCEGMKWKSIITEEPIPNCPKSVVQILHNTSKYCGQVDLSPMTLPASYWTPEAGQSRATYWTHHSLCHPSMADHSLNRVRNWSHSCKESGMNHQPLPRPSFSIGSKLSAIAPRQTPLRALTEEWLKSEEMEWFPKHAEPLEWEAWAKRYPEKRRVQLRVARLRVRLRGIQRADATVKNFVKRETTHNFTDPRNISPRTDEFLAVMGPYVSRIEHAAAGCPFLIKGTDVRERGERLRELLGYNSFVEVDFSRFDKTIHEDIIRIFEQHVLRAPFSNDHHDYLMCLSLLDTTTGVSRFGTRYKVRGTRCSGDAHTSISNGLLNRWLTWLCLRKLPKDSWISFHEGDDGVIGVREQYLEQVMYNLQFLGCMGFSAKLKSTKVLEEVIFCGRRIVFSPEKGVETLCDVTRALRKFNITCSQGHVDLLLFAKAMSYSYSDGGTPIVGPVANAVAQCLSYCTTKYSKRQLKRATANIIRERWLVEGISTPVHWRKLMAAQKNGGPTPAANAAVMHSEGINLDVIQIMCAAAEEWKRLGWIPSQVPRLILDWTPEPRNITVYGNMSQLM